MKLTAEMLRRIALSTPNANIVALIADGINTHGARFGIDQPHRWRTILPMLRWKAAALRARLRT